MVSSGLPATEHLSTLDPWLEPHHADLQHRVDYITRYSQKLCGNKPIEEVALGHQHFGLHRTDDGWIFREWAPGATQIFLIGEFSLWQEDDRFALSKTRDGQWEIALSSDTLKHGDHYKLSMHWMGGHGDRIPAWAQYVVQDPDTKLFDAVVWEPDHPYSWHDEHFNPSDEQLFIYEAHIGMSSEKETVSTYREFTKNVIPRIKASGYNAVQLMAIAEHPYYGSFGYHVSSFFAPSSRFGTPDEFRMLVDAAHQAGLRVIMDIVHSHAVKNEVEGLSRYDGTLTQFFHAGDRGNHEHWDSRVFDYGKTEVAHFLLSNCRYWLDEFHVDGFRFDGVTSMLYTHHGMDMTFDSYDRYFENTDDDALAYLTLANLLIHSVKPSSVTIAEDMSGMPGLAAPISEGGAGFDYRLSMGMPDIWIKHIKDMKDEEWKMSHLFHELTGHRPEEKTISYAESHDQALVGDKTLIFRLCDSAMYDHMMIGDDNLLVDRGIALHKMIRLLTASLNSGGYLNFMGNEFGHPEWIDFPREGNDWSYKYARRQWSLRDDKKLKYHYLTDFDRIMIKLASILKGSPGHVITNDGDHVIAFTRGDFLFAFNFHPEKSYTDYGVPAPDGKYTVVMNTDSKGFGGFGRIDTAITYPCSKGMVKLYLPARTAIVLSRHNATIDI